jgi:hypothetical protein
LRIEILDDQRDATLAKLGSWGWNPRPIAAGSRLVPSGNSAVFEATSIYELDLPRDNQPTPLGEIPKDDEPAEVLSAEEQAFFRAFAKLAVRRDGVAAPSKTKAT